MTQHDLPNFDDYLFDAKSELKSFATRYSGPLGDDELRELRNDEYRRLDDLQEQLYAEKKQSLLIVLQAMDAAGKDSSIARLTRRLNAQGCLVHSFKKPTDLELAHDFLWRVHQKAPSQGEIALFNRSHYEDVLIVKVHGWADAKTIEQRYAHINAFESLLADRGTQVLKFMLNISPEYQLSRFRSRLENSEKHWKFNPGDLDERQHWDAYMDAFQIAMQKCSSSAAPWYVVPAENRRFRDFMLARIVADKLQTMSPEYPEPDFELDQYPPDQLV